MKEGEGAGRRQNNLAKNLRFSLPKKSRLFGRPIGSGQVRKVTNRDQTTVLQIAILVNLLRQFVL